MIPDGAHSFAQDWTIFFLNQTPGNTIAPVFSDSHSDVNVANGTGAKGDPELIYVLNLVRTKKDPNAPRCAELISIYASCLTNVGKQRGDCKGDGYLHTAPIHTNLPGQLILSLLLLLSNPSHLT